MRLSLQACLDTAGPRQVRRKKNMFDRKAKGLSDKSLDGRTWQRYSSLQLLVKYKKISTEEPSLMIACGESDIFLNDHYSTANHRSPRAHRRFLLLSVSGRFSSLLEQPLAVLCTNDFRERGL